MSDTPRTDALVYSDNNCVEGWHLFRDLCRQLERELSAAQKTAELRHNLLCMTHADAMELWEALVVLSYILNTAERKAKEILDKHRQAYSKEARSQVGGQVLTQTCRPA